MFSPFQEPVGGHAQSQERKHRGEQLVPSKGGVAAGHGAKRLAGLRKAPGGSAQCPGDQLAEEMAIGRLAHNPSQNIFAGKSN